MGEIPDLKRSIPLPALTLYQKGTLSSFSGRRRRIGLLDAVIQVLPKNNKRTNNIFTIREKTG